MEKNKVEKYPLTQQKITSSHSDTKPITVKSNDPTFSLNLHPFFTLFQQNIEEQLKTQSEIFKLELRTQTGTFNRKFKSLKQKLTEYLSFIRTECIDHFKSELTIFKIELLELVSNKILVCFNSDNTIHQNITTAIYH